MFFIYALLEHSHKKWKDSMEGMNLDPAWSRSSVTCGWTWVPKDTSTQATSACIKWKHLMCWKVRIVKTPVFFIGDQLFGALIHLYYFDVNLFLIYDAWCKLCNIWLLLWENNSSSITILELINTGGKYCCSYYSRQDDRWQFEKAN